MIKKFVFAAAALLAMVSCGKAGFQVSGVVEGGADSVKMVIEQASNGRWLIVDSVFTSGNGEFSVEVAAPAYPDIYRLRYGAGTICFPVDSIDKIEIKTDVKQFATAYTLAGTDDAVSMMNIDKKAMEISLLNGEERSKAIEAWKKDLVGQILSSPGSIISYYIINKYIGNEPLFDPLVKRDMQVIGAVANGYYTFSPNDPRTAYLVRLLQQGRAYHKPNAAVTDTVVASEASIIDITLQDNNGVEQSLEKLAAEKRVILLNFTVYATEFSPAYNAVLADLYKKYEKKGLCIYQVSLDGDEFTWRQSAANLPWITVYDPASLQSQNVMKYNVTQIPLTYVISNGEIVERVAEPAQLEHVVANYM